jgi:catechol 2,3-dioxygenase-like lactoylglutathione lyase family enzyme
MLLYVTLGTNDLERAGIFYDAVLSGLGASRSQAFATAIAWNARSGPALMLTTPFDRNPAAAGNGQMAALAAPDRDTVDMIHRTALAAGGRCEGPPGERGPGFYAAYFRDPDGNKLAVVRLG